MQHHVIHIQHYNSPCGMLVIGAWKGGVCLCDWKDEPHHTKVLNRLQKYLQSDYLMAEDKIILTAMKQLDEYFAGKRRLFDLPLLFAGTDFQRHVWQTLLSVPYGITISYAQLSEQIGQPNAVRAVANAVGANAMSVIVPCHRIIGTMGTLTGYAGGVETKRYLLELERNC